MEQRMSSDRICNNVQRHVFSFGLAIGIALAPPSDDARAQSQNNFAAWEKFDFTPGDTVVFFDDFSADELDAFPEMWDLVSGECQVVEVNQQSWLSAIEDSEVDAYLESPLPEAFAVELTVNILRSGKPGQWVVAFFDTSKNQQAEFSFDALSASFLTPSGSASSFEQNVEGRQRVAIMYQDGRFKCYVGKQRVSDAATPGFKPASLRIGMFAGVDTEDHQVRFTDFRITAKRGTPQQLLYEQKRWVCYGIYFDFGAATIRGESFATLQQIGELMKKDPTLNLRLEDHSNDKEDDGDNARLSQDRAEALKNYLLETFNLAKDRVQTNAWGAGRPLGPTDTPDGWEMNRRVELIKL
jgi:outer membrane protein OmpA-like peptidoglycan-associated protein